MRTVHLSKCGLILLFLAIWNVGQAQDSLGMRYLSGLEYWQGADMIQMVGDLAYVVGGMSGLHIMSLADPANPVEIGRFTWYQMSRSGGGVYVIDDVAYLGTAAGGFVLDVSDPTSPMAIGQWSSTIGSVIKFVHGDFAIAAEHEGCSSVWDVSDPANVHYIADFPGTGGLGEPVGMAGEYLCMTGYPGGIVLYDMSTPSDPQWVSSIDTVFNTWYAAISGNYCYVTTLDNGLRIVDVSDPLRPMEVAACDSGGWSYDVTVTGSHAVVLKGTNTDVWLNIWNIANPIDPVFEGMIPVHTFGWYRVSSSENLVCTAMAGFYYSVMVLDISNPTAPVEVSSFGPSGMLFRSTIGGTTAFLADGRASLRTVDVADPNNLIELGHMSADAAEGFDLAIGGDFAYLVAELDASGARGIVILDISNPAQPESLGCVLYDGACRIVIEGVYAYVARLFQIATFSLANPTQPQCVNVLDLPSGDMGLGLAARNGYLYYGAETSFYVCSLSNPAAPELVGSCNLGGDCVVDLAVAGNYVYAADGYGGTRIVDVSNPTSPSEINWIDGYWVGSVAAAGNIAIMDDLTRVSIYDVTSPLNPALVGYYSTYEYMTDMEIQEEYLFTTSLCEFRVYECEALATSIESPGVNLYDFGLYPCYPNPFNSILVIPFTAPIQKEVVISIYNILGQKVQEFALPPLSPGTHGVIWNSGSCASGIYFVRMIANGQEHEQKVVLLK